jgi:peptidoglycan/LPS O-acetylase OafA/YrhL
MGILAYRVRPETIMTANTLFALSVVGLALSVLFQAPDEIIVSIFVSIIVFGANLSGFMDNLFSQPALVYLGEASYSLYLVHALVLSVVYNAFKLRALAAAPNWIPDAVCLVLVIPAAALLYHAIERPSRTIIRRIVSTARKKDRPGAL